MYLFPGRIYKRVCDYIPGHFQVIPIEKDVHSGYLSRPVSADSYHLGRLHQRYQTYRYAADNYGGLGYALSFLWWTDAYKARAQLSEELNRAIPLITQNYCDNLAAKGFEVDPIEKTKMAHQLWSYINFGFLFQFILDCKQGFMADYVYRTSTSWRVLLANLPLVADFITFDKNDDDDSGAYLESHLRVYMLEEEEEEDDDEHGMTYIPADNKQLTWAKGGIWYFLYNFINPFRLLVQTLTFAELIVFMLLDSFAREGSASSWPRVLLKGVVAVGVGFCKMPLIAVRNSLNGFYKLIDDVIISPPVYVLSSLFTDLVSSGSRILLLDSRLVTVINDELLGGQALVNSYDDPAETPERIIKALTFASLKQENITILTESTSDFPVFPGLIAVRVPYQVASQFWEVREAASKLADNTEEDEDVRLLCAHYGVSDDKYIPNL